MNIHPIRTKTDYKRALREVSAYFNDEPEPGSGRRLVGRRSCACCLSARHS